MSGGMKSLRWTALLLPLTVLTGCPEEAHDEDQIQSVAATGSNVVVTARTSSVGGYGCGGLDEGTPALFVSGDAGRSFERIVPASDRAIDAIGMRDGTFFVLRSGYDGFTVESSTDGLTWTERTSAAASAHDLIVDATGVHVAHLEGISTSPDGLAWTHHDLDDDSLYAPRLTRVGELFVLATADGRVQTSPDGDTWTARPIDLGSVVRLANASTRAIAIARAERNDTYGNFLVGFDPATDDAPSFTPIDDGVMAVVDAPVGILVGDGTLAADGVLGTRTAHTRAFQAGAVDGARVILASDRGVAISTDGGASFGAPSSLPLLR